MKTVPNIKTTQVVGEGPAMRKAEISTRDVVLVIAKQPAAGAGVSYDEMAKRLRIMDVVSDPDAEEYLFEDADYSNLVGYLRTTQFGVADPDLFNILKAIIDAASVKPAALKAVE